VTRFKAQQLSQ